MNAELVSATHLVLFPGAPDAIGGVEAAGREAWRGLAASRAPVHAVHHVAGASRAGSVWRVLRHRGATHVLVWHMDLLRLVPCLRRDARIVLFLHGIEAWRQQDRLTSHLLGRVHLFLVNSRHTWRTFLHFQPHLADRRHALVPLGLDNVADQPAPPDEHAPAALMLSRLDRREDYKGHRQLIRAWRGVREQVPGAQLWIAGEGDLRPSLERLVTDEDSEGTIRFLGRLTEQQKIDRLTASRCLALPSQGEGFGLVYLEAMRLGRPCLVSTRDAGREVVNPPEAGLAADPEDAEALAAAAARLLSPGDEWQRWSVQARARYGAQFTGARFQQRLVEALATV